MQLDQATIAYVADKYAEFLQAGTSYGEALRKAAAKLGGTPCPTLLDALAKVHAAKYKCSYTWNTSGGAVFYDGKESTRESRRDDARKSWQRNVMSHFTLGTPKSESTGASKSDPVALLLAKYQALTAAQKRAFKAAL